MRTSTGGGPGGSLPWPCPACLEGVGVPIVHGLPDPELFEAAERGEVVLGGCVIGADPDRPDDNLACNRCDHRWFATGKTVALSSAEAVVHIIIRPDDT